MDLLESVSWDDLDVDEVRANSYKDFHARGLDYICLKRSPELTLKAYFFADGMESQKVGDVVNPHDHRYEFVTQCYSGVIRNSLYRESAHGRRYHQFDYLTPLNGGNGFSYSREISLAETSSKPYWPGESYRMSASEFHTIRVVAPQTLIILAQYGDVVPIDRPTATFTTDAEPPSLAGLYSQFTSDEIVKRFSIICTLRHGLLKGFQ